MLVHIRQYGILGKLTCGFTAAITVYCVLQFLGIPNLFLKLSSSILAGFLGFFLGDPIVSFLSDFKNQMKWK